MNQEPFILAVETSSRIGSAAVAFGSQIQEEMIFSAPMRHSAELFPAVSSLLERLGRKPHEIEHIYISGGPGSFTGLRIATALAKTMNLANNTKVVVVDTLDVIACNIADYNREKIDLNAKSQTSNAAIQKIATVLDAKRGQFYIAVYQRKSNEVDEQYSEFNKQYVKILKDSLISASSFLSQFAGMNKPIWLLGDGLLYHRDQFKADGIYFLDDKYWSPRANKVHMLGWQMAQQSMFADPVNLTPFYLSRPEVTMKAR